MSQHGISGVTVSRIDGETQSSQQDIVAVEEPLEIRIGYGSDTRDQKSIAVTMRTPGHDFELALGFLFSEGIIDHLSDVENVHYCEDVGKQDEKENVVRVELARHIIPDFEKLERNFYMTSSCGVCGKSSIEAIEVSCEKINESSITDRQVIFGLIDEMEKKQHLFGATGGIHASGLFNLKGNLMLVREDIGRHNALDKIIGARFLKKDIPIISSLLVLSGRAGFELVQKSIRAQIPILVSVGAPSSLSVELAQEFNLTLIGFLKGKKLNIYSGKERIK